MSAKLNIACILLAICAGTGCAYRSNNLQYEPIDTFCIWARPITLTSNELLSLSKETLKEIDYYNSSYDNICFDKGIK